MDINPITINKFNKDIMLIASYNINPDATLSIRLIEPIVIYAIGLKSFLHKHFKSISLNIICNTSLPNGQTKELSNIYDLVFYSVPNNLEPSQIKRKLAVIRKLYPGSKIILLSLEFNSQILEAVFNNAFNGYFLLSEDPEEVTKVINQVMDGDCAISERVLLSYLCDKAVQRININVENNDNLSEYEIRALELLSLEVPTVTIEGNIKCTHKNWKYFINILSSRIKNNEDFN